MALLAFDQCGMTAAQNSAVIPVRSLGGGRLTVTSQVLTATPTSTASRVTARPYGGDVTASFNAAAARTLGTAAPDQLLIQAAEAVNIIPQVRVFQNNRNTETRGTILPVDMGATTTGLTDMAADNVRRQLYIANPGLNRIEVFDMRTQKFLTAIGVGQQPRSVAIGGDGNTLYVANSGGESISIVDLNRGLVSGRVAYPPLWFNASLGGVDTANRRIHQPRPAGVDVGWDAVENRRQHGSAPVAEHHRLRHGAVDSGTAEHGRQPGWIVSAAARRATARHISMTPRLTTSSRDEPSLRTRSQAISARSPRD